MIKVFEKSKTRAGLKLYGEIGTFYNNGVDFSRILDDLERKYTTIDIHLHCYGGNVFEGNLIYNLLLNSKATIDFYIDGIAASMATIIMLPARKIYMSENSFILIHTPSGDCSGNAKAHLENAKLLRSMEKNFIKKYAQKTGKKKEEISKWLDGEDYWFSADEAKAEGFIDEIIDPVVKDIKALEVKEGNVSAKDAYSNFAALLKSDVELNKNQMDKKEVIAKFNLTSVTAESSDTAVMEALEAKLKAQEEAKEKAEKELGDSKTETITALVKDGVKAGKIKAESEQTYIEIGEKTGIENLKAILGDINPRESISAKITNKKKTNPDGKGKDRSGWDWDDYQKNDVKALENMRDKEPEKFEELYNAKYKQ